MTKPAANDPLWYKDAIIYQLHVKAFFDSNGDGFGDFAGVTSKFDYLQSLGVNTLWLLPFYPSPLRDDGYDIANYRDVNPNYGTLEDFRHFIDEAHRRGLRVITELVINHTSDQHPWFQRARHAPVGSPERDYYVWSDDDQKYAGTPIIFTDTETSNWTWDPVAKQYYWHRFFSHQPDLNFDNPAVLKEVIDIMYFWLDLGVDGMRLDAVPYLVEREGTTNDGLPETHGILKQIRAAMDARYSDRLLLAEANQWPEDVRPYFGDGDECHMAFHFPLMPRLYMALAQEDRHPITDILYQTPAIPENCQWAMFLRNHDELTLEMVTDRERDYLWGHYAADARARVNVGIRRRLTSLMEGDRRKVELLNGILMSMPGTPIVYYGDEIGMGDNIYLGDRDAVRTPMQWSPDRNGGFSMADPARLYLPAIMDPVYGFQSVNVESQQRVKSSLYHWMRQLMAARPAQVFGRGRMRFLRSRNRQVLTYLREFEGEAILCVANLSRRAQSVEVELSDYAGHTPQELLAGSHFPTIGEGLYPVTLAPYGFFWFRLCPEPRVEPGHERPELQTLVLHHGWQDLLDGPMTQPLMQEILPAYLRSRHGAVLGKNEKLRVVAIEPLGPCQLVVLEAAREGEAPHYFVLPVGLAWETRDEIEPIERWGKDSICRVRQRKRVGILYDGFAHPDFLAALRHALETEAGRTFHGALEAPPAGEGASIAALGEGHRLRLIRQPELGAKPAAKAQFAIRFNGAAPMIVAVIEQTNQ